MNAALRLFSDPIETMATRNVVTDSLATYGLYPRCAECGRDCKVPNEPGLLKLICPTSPEYRQECRARGMRT